MEMVLHPKSEIDARIKKLQSQMGDMDGAILFQSVDMLYFSHCSGRAGLYPRDGQTVIQESLPQLCRSLRDVRPPGLEDLMI
jgi:hypothetical protein